jgi:hypothetical protein
VNITNKLITKHSEGDDWSRMSHTKRGRIEEEEVRELIRSVCVCVHMCVCVCVCMCRCMCIEGELTCKLYLGNWKEIKH